MNIYIDENIPYAKPFFEDHGKVTLFSGRTVTAEQLKDADVLLVRSITQVNESLLKLNVNLKFVGTATIGMDHIDQNYLQQRGITFSSAPGCNKISVAEYILSSLFVLSKKQQFLLLDKSVAIVGAGNTGSALWQRLTALGINCKLYDPPLAEAGDPRDFCSFEEVLQADIISLHVPKIVDGEYPTYHLFNHKVLQKLSTEQILLNASRGEVIDNEALLTLAKKGKIPTLVLDVWENEPNINKALLPFVAIATPHIAGYSLDGKGRATEMLYQDLCYLFKIEIKHKMQDFMVKAAINELMISYQIDLKLFRSLMLLIFDVRRDDTLFRKMIDQPDGFDNMRKNYQERRELSTLLIHSCYQQNKLLQLLGFSTDNIKNSKE